MKDSTTTRVNFDYPDGLSEEGVTDVERLNDQVIDGIESTSFALDYEIESTDDSTYKVSETARYDPESEEGLTRVQASSGERSVNYATYQSGSKVYMAEGLGGQVEYSAYDLSTGENRFDRRTAVDTAREDLDFVDSLTYAVDSVEVRDGRAVAALTITGTSEGDDSWVSDPSGRMYVSEAAWPVEFRYEGTSSEGSFEANGEFSDIGSAEVDKPDWVQKAKGS
ncbi:MULTISPECIES: hypothetical protein [Halorussus]|uniref:hypothetical protein n=1 Tax=Halorussus TaxID=1070314 RepID=UPI000E20CA48|nr:MULTISPECIES: hypothetical protein [Halorussus]NHN60737.1 hypothetical protein [Halorussus sp. JP-T4]